jgi:glycerophosphoryl diester phosphodiesterase
VHVEGHRGARGLKPENTLQAFETALDIGVTTLELDLHLTADNVVVVWHDTNFGADKCRFTDPSLEYPADGIAVTSLTENDLADYQCDLNPDNERFPDQDSSATPIAGDDYQPVTLAAVFDFVVAYAESPDKTDEQRARATAVEFNIETKRDVDDPAAIGDGFDGINPGEFELQTLAVIDAANVAGRVIIQSFDHRSLWAIRSVSPDTRVAALTSFEPPNLDEMASHGASIWSPNFNVMTKELIDQAHALGLLVIPWTVNDAESMQAVIDNGADGYITDRPDIAATLR